MKKFLIYILNAFDTSIQQDNIRAIKKELGRKINIYIDVGSHKGEMINLLLHHFRLLL